jgi:hypothetical protein
VCRGWKLDGHGKERQFSPGGMVFCKIGGSPVLQNLCSEPRLQRLSGPAASTPKIDTRAAIVLGLTWWIAELQGHSLVSCGGGCGRWRVDVKLSSLRHIPLDCLSGRRPDTDEGLGGDPYEYHTLQCSFSNNMILSSLVRSFCDGFPLG